MLFLRNNLATACAAAVLLLGGGVPATAHDLGPLGAALQQPAAQGWEIIDQNDVVILRNDGRSSGSQALVYDPGQAPAGVRSHLLSFSFASDDPRAALIYAITNARTQSNCYLVISQQRLAVLDCVDPSTSKTVARLENAVKLDGSDRLQVIEQGGITAFFVNETEVGRLKDHPAQGGGMGIITTGAGTFYLGHFSVKLFGDTPDVPEAAPPSASPDPGQSDTPTRPDAELLAEAFQTAPRRLGWQTLQGRDAWQLENRDMAGDEQLVPLTIAPRGDATRLIAVDVALAPVSETVWSSRAAAGLFWENRQTGQSCSLQITSGGDGVLLCFTASGQAKEIARLHGVARGPGPHTMAIIESGEDLIAMIGENRVGVLSAHPSLGGDISLYAYERGRFSYSNLKLEMIAPQPGRLPSPPPGQPGDPTGNGLAGPLPLFGEDRDRAAAAYLGITRSIFLHELGHALIGELAVPATGPEEDAVDIYSALQMADAMIFPGDNPVMARTAQMAAGYAALAWYYSGKISEGQTPADARWQDEHTADLKRFRNMFCVLYGANPRAFSGLAQGVQMEERTLARCEDEFRKQSRAWRAILSPYTRVSPVNPEGLLPAATRGAAVEVELKPSGRQIGEYMRQTYGDLLTEAAVAVGESYVLPRPLRVTYQDCDMANAWYAPSEGSITMCYEVIEHFAVLISDIEAGTQGGYARTASASPAAPAAAPRASGRAAFDELADAGVPTTLRLFPAPYRGPTPTEIPDAMIITTAELGELMPMKGEYLLIDTRSDSPTQSLPGAILLTGLGEDGSLHDSLQLRIETFLEKFTGGDSQLPLIITGAGPDDRASYNAARRIGSAGYRALWYRGGIEAWVANGLSLEPLE